RILLRDDEHLELLRAKGQHFNHDAPDDNASSQAQTTVDPPDVRSGTIICEEPADSVDCQMRVNHEADWVKYHQVSGEVTVQGWLNRDGKLWWNDRRKTVVVKAPTLLPNDTFGFMIRGVTH